MYSTQSQSELGVSQSVISSEVSAQRALDQESAHRMVLLAMRQWERAISGIIAVPSAIAVTTAAGAMLVSSFVQRAFETVETATMDVGRRVGRDYDGNGNPRTNGRVADVRERRPEGAA